jgi:uncharacterized protein YjdB
LYWKSANQVYEIIPQDQFYPTYTAIPVTSLTVSPDSLTLEVGKSQTLTYTVLPDNATNGAISWSSDDPKVATVSNIGKVVAKTPGITNITITNEDTTKTATCVVTVMFPTAITDVSPNSKFLVFPNPTNGDKITISGISANSTIEICDLSGKVLVKKANKLENEITFTNLNLKKGFYLISVLNNGTKSTAKLIIE